MKTVVDYDLCEANALCMEACPEVFRVEDDDTLTVLMDEVPEELRAKLQDAERLCPRQAFASKAKSFSFETFGLESRMMGLGKPGVLWPLVMRLRI